MADSNLALQKDPLLSSAPSDSDFAHNERRASFIPNNRDSYYADSTYEYRPPTSGTYHTRTQSSGHLGVVETRQPKRLSGYDAVSQGGESFGDGSETVRGRNDRPTRRKSRGAEVAVYEDRSGY